MNFSAWSLAAIMQLFIFQTILIPILARFKKKIGTVLSLVFLGSVFLSTFYLYYIQATGVPTALE